jgi:hypothetical protein
MEVSGILGQYSLEIDYSVQQSGTDLIVNTPDGVLYYSKFALMMTSKYFKTMLQSSMKEGQSGEIKIERPKSALNTLFNYISSHEDLITRIMLIDIKNVFIILDMAEEYQMPLLKTSCENWLTRNIKDVSIVALINVCITYSLSDLEKKLAELFDSDDTHKAYHAILINSPDLGELLYDGLFKYGRLLIELLDVAIKWVSIGQNRKQASNCIIKAMSSLAHIFEQNRQLTPHRRLLLDRLFELVQYCDDDKISRGAACYIIKHSHYAGRDCPKRVSLETSDDEKRERVRIPNA